MEKQLYCISARSRASGFTEDITGAMTEEEARNWKPRNWIKKTHVYFRVSKYPFKRHKK